MLKICLIRRNALLSKTKNDWENAQGATVNFVDEIQSNHGQGSRQLPLTKFENTQYDKHKT